MSTGKEKKITYDDDSVGSPTSERKISIHRLSKRHRLAGTATKTRSRSEQSEELSPLAPPKEKGKFEKRLSNKKCNSQAEITAKNIDKSDRTCKFHRENFDRAMTNEVTQSRFILYLNQEERAILYGFYMSVRRFKQQLSKEEYSGKEISMMREAIEDIDRRYLGILDGKPKGSFLWEKGLRDNFKARVDRGDYSMDIFDRMVQYVGDDLQHLFYDFKKSEQQSNEKKSPQSLSKFKSGYI